MGIKPSVHSGGICTPRRRNTVNCRHPVASHPAVSADDHSDAKYIMHEEWLTDVCGVARRRLSLQNGDDMLLSSGLPTIGVCLSHDEPPTYEQAVEWSKSFDYLMESKTGQRMFRDYLQSEYSEENILFWQACEELKEVKDEEAVKEKAKLIFEDYISSLSPREVSLDGKTRESIHKDIMNPSVQTFTEAQLQIYLLMQRDSYPRFLNSKMFQRLLER